VEEGGEERIRPLRIAAAWALPVDAVPIRDAAVLVGADGRIAAVGPATAVPTPSDAEALTFPAGILLPGLVNTHTHLELTGFAPTAPELEFHRWILSIRRLKQARPPADFVAAARRGLLECWAGGVTTIADTGDSGAAVEALQELRGSGIAYQEVFGPHPAQREASLADLARRMEQLTAGQGDRVRLGVSPHAPYTVSGPLYADVAAWARARGLPLAVHLAESLAETQFVSASRGPFAEAWQARGIPLPHDPLQQPPTVLPSDAPTVRPTASPVRWLDAHRVLGPDTLCIHAVQLDADDIKLLAQRRVAVAHCPVSNAAHGHGSAPLAALLQAGLRVGIGTDSVASVGVLDLFREARAAQALAGLSDAEALALATLDGARALGLEPQIGSLTPRKWGDLTVVAAAAGPAETAPLRAVLQASPVSVLLTALGGRIVHRAPPA